MKLLSFQPFSLYTGGGGNRILRRLFEGHEKQITSLAIATRKLDGKKGSIQEEVIYTFPTLKSWTRSYLRNITTWLAERFFLFVPLRRLRKKAGSIPHDVLHIVNHGPFLDASSNDVICSGKRVWVSFHDHYLSTNSTAEIARDLWNRAERRLVISPEMGEEYSRLFGAKPYEIITDGLLEDGISQPAVFAKSPVKIYFAGLLHIDYYPLFQSLADALDTISKDGISFQFILRGTQELTFLNNRSFTVEYRPFSLNGQELKQELDEASILYLPLMFTNPDFYLYSLSTKLIGYLGGAGTILYHGPGDSAACRLLEKNKSAICCPTTDREEVVKSVYTILNGGCDISGNAKTLAKKQFNLNEIRARFWQAEKTTLPHEA